MFYKPAAWFYTQHFKQPTGSLLSSPRPKCPLFVLHLINSPTALEKFCVQHYISSPSEATIKYKRTQIVQGPSCETYPLSPFGDFLLPTPMAVGVNRTCIKSKLVKKHSRMRVAMSKIFSKGKRNGDIALSLWRICCDFALIDCQLFNWLMNLAILKGFKFTVRTSSQVNRTFSKGYSGKIYQDGKPLLLTTNWQNLSCFARQCHPQPPQPSNKHTNILHD